MDVRLIFAHLHIQLVSKAEIKLSGSASFCKGLRDVSLSSEDIQYVEALCGCPCTSEFSATLQQATEYVRVRSYQYSTQSISGA